MVLELMSEGGRNLTGRWIWQAIGEFRAVAKKLSIVYIVDDQVERIVEAN